MTCELCGCVIEAGREHRIAYRTDRPPYRACLACSLEWDNLTALEAHSPEMFSEPKNRRWLVEWGYQLASHWQEIKKGDMTWQRQDRSA